jgi:hypothetical protein
MQQPTEIQQPSTCSVRRIIAATDLLANQSTNTISLKHSIDHNSHDVIHPIVVVALLLLAVGSNAELLRGTSREHNQERNL